MAGHSLVISHAKRADFEAAYAFHTRNAGEYLWPRSDDAFGVLIEERQLYIVKDGQRVVGLCYVIEEGRVWEFGGVYVEEELRGLGVAAALGRVAISTSFLTDDLPERLIAHVHEFNDAPRRLLTGQLGFEATGERDIPPVTPPASMRRNEQGDVVGEVFEFRLAALGDYVSWFEAFTGVLVGKLGVEIPLTIVADVWTQRAALLPALMEISSVNERHRD